MEKFDFVLKAIHNLPEDEKKLAAAGLLEVLWKGVPRPAGADADLLAIAIGGTRPRWRTASAGA